MIIEDLTPFDNPGKVNFTPKVFNFCLKKQIGCKYLKYVKHISLLQRKKCVICVIILI